MLLTGDSPSLTHARVMGFSAYLLRMRTKQNFESRDMEDILLEHFEFGVYKILLKKNDETYASVDPRHVNFNKKSFLRLPFFWQFG